MLLQVMAPLAIVLSQPGPSVFALLDMVDTLSTRISTDTSISEPGLQVLALSGQPGQAGR
jgi:hypothetical protein